MYEVIDSSLADIKYALDPTYTPEDVAVLDKRSTLATDVMGVKYLPGAHKRRASLLALPHERRAPSHSPPPSLWPHACMVLCVCPCFT